METWILSFTWNNLLYSKENSILIMYVNSRRHCMGLNSLLGRGLGKMVNSLNTMDTQVHLQILACCEESWEQGSDGACICRWLNNYRWVGGHDSPA